MARITGDVLEEGTNAPITEGKVAVRTEFRSQTVPIDMEVTSSPLRCYREPTISVLKFLVTRRKVQLSPSKTKTLNFN